MTQYSAGLYSALNIKVLKLLDHLLEDLGDALSCQGSHLLGAFSREDCLAQDTVSNKQSPPFPEQRVGNKGTGRLRSLLKRGLI